MQQGLVWKHDADWAVFNSGMGRGGDASNPQLVFLQRRDWQLKLGAGVVKPWVASSKVRSVQGASVRARLGDVLVASAALQLKVAEAGSCGNELTFALSLVK
jgi:hypothetical protein